MGDTGAMAVGAGERGSVWDLDHRLMEIYVQIQSTVRWWNPARPYLWLHMRRRLDELRAEYVRREQLAAPGDAQAEIGTRIHGLDNFRASFSLLPHVRVPKVVVSLLPAGVLVPVAHVLGIQAAVTGGAATYIALAHHCFCALFRFWMYGATAAMIVSPIIGFDGKRSILTRFNAYEVERDLWRELGLKPHVEIQLDPFGWLGVGLVVLIAKYAAQLDGEHHVTWRWNPWWSFLAASVIASMVFASSLRRPWAWRQANLANPVEARPTAKAS